MDKETLSNYGWIVICVMVLAVMIALATPFGGFIRDAVWSTTNGLFDVQNEALNAAGIVTGGSQPGAEESQPITVSGSYISVNDVESANQPLTVSLTSNTVSDFSSVNVMRYGGNLLDISQMLNECLTDNGDGTYKLSVVDEYKRSSASFAVNIPANIPFVMVAEITEKNTLDDNIIFATLKFADGTSETVTFAHVDFSTHSYQFDKQITNITLLLRRNASYIAVGDYFNFKNAMINIGQEQPYQEYIAPQSVAASSDGTVSGLSSAAPGMTLITDNSEVVINCEYKKKQ